MCRRGSGRRCRLTRRPPQWTAIIWHRQTHRSRAAMGKGRHSRLPAARIAPLHASPGAHGAAARTARSAQTGRPVGVEAVAPDRARTSQLSPLSPVDRIGRQDEDMTFKYTEGRKGTPSNRQYPVKLSRCAEEAADPSRSRGHRPPPPCAGIDSDQCWCPKLK
jgi:hypothetical protein